jgi:hypothetical protein
VEKAMDSDNSSRFFLSKEEQYFLMEVLEIRDVQKAFDRFAEMLVEERCNPQQIDKYIKRIHEAYKKKKDSKNE